jgi:ATP-dependent Clp protease ATP-binding subunit ClpX
MPAKLPFADARPQRSVSELVAAIPLLSPRDCDERLQKLGYRGQPHARRAASVLAYRHVRRLRRVHLEGVLQENLGPRENYLFVGPTGCGKTFLVELLFNEILNVPTVTVDITQYSETGYVGDDVNMILSRLFETAEQSLEWAACGVVCIDEFDKLASSRSSARFAGEGTTKDVSGYGVQRGLLALLSGREASFPADFGYAHMSPKLAMPLANLSFIACGAFSGLKTTADLLGATERIGFGREASPLAPEAIAVQLDDSILEQTAAFARYGFLPELIGRFSRVVAFAPLDGATLRAILDDCVLDDYRREFADEGLELAIEEPVLEHVVAGAIKRELGARGLRAAMAPYLEEAAYTHFGNGCAGRVRLFLSDGAISVGSG